jgi:hypothetical protein
MIRIYYFLIGKSDWQGIWGRVRFGEIANRTNRIIQNNFYKNMIYNHIHNPIETQKLILDALHFLFTPDTLVLCDTRSLIKKEVLPHIPFVGYYDQRILPILSNTNIIFSD